MTSVVDTSVKYIHSDMSGAPVLTGQAGSLIALLDAFLVTGFGLTSATSLVVSGGVATLTFSGSTPAEMEAVIVVDGSSIAALNGEQKVTGKTATAVTFATAAADGTATGTITFKVAPLGWTKAYSDTNKAAYKSADPTSTGCYLYVDDTSTGAARVVGYESMSSLSAGTGPFPTSAQVSGGGYWGKSFTTGSNPVRYTLWGDSKAFFTAIAARTGNDTSSAAYVGTGVRGFGDMIAYRPSGDAYCCALSCNTSSSWNSNPNYSTFDAAQAAAGGGLYFPRSWTGLGSAWQGLSYPYTGSSGSISGSDNTLGSFPSPIDGGLRLSKRYIRDYNVPQDVNYAVRADVPGLYTLPHSYVYPQLGYRNKVPGTGALTGRTLLSVAVTNNYSNLISDYSLGVALVDLTGPWR